MTYYAINERDAIAEAVATFNTLLQRDAETVTRTVGWQGGGGDFPIHWHSSLGLWGLSVPLSDHYWFGWGTENILQVTGIAETVQINFGNEKASRAYGGLFVRDDAGDIYVAHSGKIGGGRRGIGMNNFLDFLMQKSTRFVNVVFPGKVKHEYILLGKLSDGAELLKSIAKFAQYAKEFKDGVTTSKK